MDDLDKRIHEAYMRVINPLLDEMKTTAMDAISILAKGDENAAWKKALEDEGILSNVTKQKWLKWAYASKEYKKLKESYDVNEDDITAFVDDPKVADKIFDDIKKSMQKLVFDIIPKIKKEEEKIIKKYQLEKNARIFVKNFGTAYLHDVFRELLGQELVASGNIKNRFLSRN